MPTTLADILAIGAQRRPECVALVVGDRRVAFGELDRWSDRVAEGLVGLGVLPGDRVALFGANSPEWVAAYYGVAKAGGVVNPLSAMLTSDELTYTLSDAGARIVIAADDKAAQMHDLLTAGTVDHVVLWGAHPTDHLASLDDWIAREGTSFAVRPRRAEDAAVIAYTSGTTGRPKGAVQCHRSVVAAAVGTALMASRTGKDRVVSALGANICLLLIWLLALWLARRPRRRRRSAPAHAAGRRLDQHLGAPAHQ